VGGSEYEKGLGPDLFFRYFFYRVFKLPLLRNAQKRHKKKKKKYLPTPFSGHLPDIRRFQFSFSSAPLAFFESDVYLADSR
jgi:hypothetical protein